jgi:lysyl-tRNA synthetase class 2
MLERRASLLARVRQFFAARRVLEVDTPIVVNAPVTDVHIHSARVDLGAAPGVSATGPYFLHTSPEYAMKRLLAAGSGDIYQICHVVRGYERGRLHNCEFTLIEWYRTGFSLSQLMDEVDALVRELVADTTRAHERLSYRDAFLQYLQIDPFVVDTRELASVARGFGFEGVRGGESSADDWPSRRGQDLSSRDELLEFLMGTQVGPQLGRGALTFVHGYPASQAALARLDPTDPRAALRFELYCDGVELANGFHELASEPEQRARFECDRVERRRQGQPHDALDERLLAALLSGIPDCAGVAVGFDRVLMLATGANRIEDVLAFPTEIA